MAVSNDDKVRKVATAWCNQPTSLRIPERLKEIAELLYWYRNPPKNDPVTLAKWKAFFASMPTDMINSDAEIMAAAEHYFYARSQVANGEYSLTNMKAMILGYQLVKKLGLDPRHNKDNPTTPPSKLQQHWALLGAEQGNADLAAANAERKKSNKSLVVPPTFRMPPNFTGALGGTALDKIKY